MAQFSGLWKQITFHKVWVEKHSSLQGQEIPYSWEW